MCPTSGSLTVRSANGLYGVWFGTPVLPDDGVTVGGSFTAVAMTVVVLSLAVTPTASMAATVKVVVIESPGAT